MGFGIFVCITTNERLEKLTPRSCDPDGVSPTSRYRPFPAPRPPPGLGCDDRTVRAEGFTLAELYQRRGDIRRITLTAPAESKGLYL